MPRKKKNTKKASKPLTDFQRFNVRLMESVMMLNDRNTREPSPETYPDDLVNIVKNKLAGLKVPMLRTQANQIIGYFHDLTVTRTHAEIFPQRSSRQALKAAFAEITKAVQEKSQ